MLQYLRWEWEILRQAGRDLKALVGKLGLVSEIVVAATYAVLSYLQQGPNPSMTSAAADGLMAAGALALIACFVAVAIAPYRVHRADRDRLDLLVSEDLDVDLTLSMYTDATFINVHNNEDTDDFICEVVAWGEERPLKRSHFPWKVRWEHHDSRFCTISKDTSDRLFLAKIERNEAEDVIEGEPHPRKTVTLKFMTPNDERFHTGFAYLDRESFTMRRYFLRLLVSAKKQSKATQRTLELRIIHSMEDDFEQRAAIQRPILRATFVD